MSHHGETIRHMNQDAPHADTQPTEKPPQGDYRLAWAKREFERCLRAAGYTKSQALHLVHEQFSPSITDPKTDAAETQPPQTAHQGDYLLARAKRELERRLIQDGYTKTEAMREVSAQFPPQMKGSSK